LGQPRTDAGVARIESHLTDSTGSLLIEARIRRSGWNVIRGYMQSTPRWSGSLPRYNEWDLALAADQRAPFYERQRTQKRPQDGGFYARESDVLPSPQAWAGAPDASAALTLESAGALLERAAPAHVWAGTLLFSVALMERVPGPAHAGAAPALFWAAPAHAWAGQYLLRDASALLWARPPQARGSPAQAWAAQSLLRDSGALLWAGTVPSVGASRPSEGQSRPSVGRSGPKKGRRRPRGETPASSLQGNAASEGVSL
jgi:hypothetical protein